jgi:hypothetical protein
LDPFDEPVGGTKRLKSEWIAGGGVCMVGSLLDPWRSELSSRKMTNGTEDYDDGMIEISLQRE